MKLAKCYGNSRASTKTTSLTGKDHSLCHCLSSVQLQARKSEAERVKSSKEVSNKVCWKASDKLQLTGKFPTVVSGETGNPMATVRLLTLRRTRLIQADGLTGTGTGKALLST
jgi:hypothetical protein